MSKLAGKRIVNTRAPHQSAELDALIRVYGAEPVPYPCIEIVPPENLEPLDTAIQQLLNHEFDGLILTSANTVYAIETRLETLGYSPRILADINIHVAVVGSKTAESAQERLGLTINTTPPEFVAEALAEELSRLENIQGTRFFLPQSAIAPPLLSELLLEMGVEVACVPAYDTQIATGGALLLPQISEIDAITFTSGSTARNFIKRFRQEGGDVADLDDVVIACIGPKAAKTAMEWVFDVRVIPEEHTLEGMLTALVDYFEKN